MASAGYLFDEDFLNHLAPAGHPERPERLPAIDRLIADRGLQGGLRPVPARPATDEELLRIHTRALLDRIAGTEGAAGHIDADTFYSAGSHRAARLAAGGTIDACREALAGRIRNAFCAVRPPGHHARLGTAMGFCLFNNVAVAGAALLENGLERVAILDFDVHHGNGTEEAFLTDERVLYISLHQSPLYPGTGDSAETGGGAAAGLNLNFPVPAGTGGGEYAWCFETVIEPAVARFRPEFCIISAGFDGDARDPLGDLELGPDDFAWMTAAAMSWVPAGRTVAVLEGGYELTATAEGAAKVIEMLIGQEPPERPVPVPNEAAERTAGALKAALDGR